MVRAVRGGYKVVQGITGSYKGLAGVQGVTGVYQLVTRGYRGLQKVA